MKLSPAQKKALDSLEDSRSFIKLDRGRHVLIQVANGYAVRRTLRWGTFEALKARGLIKSVSRPSLGVLGRNGNQTVWIKAQ